MRPVRKSGKTSYSRKLQEDLERLQTQFSEYREAVQKSMEEQLTKEDEKLGSTLSAASAQKAANRVEEIDADYFTSYAYNGMFFLTLGLLGFFY